MEALNWICHKCGQTNTLESKSCWNCRARKPKAEAQNENWVKKQIKAILKEFGVQYFMPSAGEFGKRGVHDFVCCFRGRYLSIEAKSFNKRPEEHQIDFGKAVQAASGVSVVIHRDNLPALRSLLERMSQLPEGPGHGTNWTKYDRKKRRTGNVGKQSGTDPRGSTKS